jgi:FtsP/CotA-like multicopper oxidase with cupredoxin domain
MVAILISCRIALGETLRDLPEVRGDVTLRAAIDGNGRDAFWFNGSNLPPVIRVSPGDSVKIAYENDLPSPSVESCGAGPCDGMSNLHFHGLTVSPKAPQDDVLSMMAMPGQTLHYVLDIPRDQQPGLFWYHTHPHGESWRQALDGMSGAIVIDGIERYVPEVRNLRERILVLRGRDIEHDAQAKGLRTRVGMKESCGAEDEAPERVLTVNGQVRPEIAIAPGERQFWRIVNAAADSYADLEIPGTRWEIVALDGMPLAYRDPQHPTKNVDHVLLSPGARVEAIVTGPANSHAVLRSRCVDTGSAGDPNPQMVVADIVAQRAVRKVVSAAVDSRSALYKPVNLSRLKSTEPQFVVIVVTFTEDKKGFYINGQKYEPDADPMIKVRVGGYQHWRIVKRRRSFIRCTFIRCISSHTRSTASRWRPRRGSIR